MIRSLYYQPGKPLQTDLKPADFPRAVRNPRGLLWVDFSGESAEVCQPILERFGFHPLAIDDALAERHVPKVDDWGDYLYIVFDTISLIGNNGAGWATESEELDVFIGHNYLVTHHDLPIPSLDEIWSAVPRDPRNLQEGTDHLLYKIVDRLTSDYMHFVEQVDLAINEIEDEVFDRPTRGTLEQLFSLKRVLQSMRRIITPQREVLNKLARDDFRVIDPRDRVFFRDVYDHMVRLHDLNESMRDLVGGALDSYLSVINNRMNEVMKTLTIITTLFMPMSFIAGVFGMNFFVPRSDDAIWELMTRPVFFNVIALLALVPIIMYLWMRKRTWI
jgi:magnesium transporter